MRRSKDWPWIAAMWRAVIAPRIFIKKGGQMLIRCDDKCELRAAHDHNPTIMVEKGGLLTIEGVESDSLREVALEKLS